MQNYYFSDMKFDSAWTHVEEPERYMTVDEWSYMLAHYKCTYVYVAATNADFEEMYGELFEDEIIDGRIYTVLVDGNNIRLKSIVYK